MGNSWLRAVPSLGIWLENMVSYCLSVRLTYENLFSGFAGKNAWDEAQVDALSDQFKDFCKSFQPYIAAIFGVGEGDKEKLKEEVFLPAAKTNLPYFVRALKNSGSGYLVGDSLTYMDLMIAELTSSFFEKNAPEVLDEFPEMRKHYKKVQSHPDLKKWIETRPETVF